MVHAVVPPPADVHPAGQSVQVAAPAVVAPRGPNRPAAHAVPSGHALLTLDWPGAASPYRPDGQPSHASSSDPFPVAPVPCFPAGHRPSHTASAG